MPIFALETSTERLSLAIVDGEKIVVREIDAGQRHSELAVDAITALFADANSTISAMDVLAFGQGPGSFVGVRIACGLAQGLALGAGKNLLPVPTHMALAEQAFRVNPNAMNVVVAIDARMNEVYLAAYQRDANEASGWHQNIAPMLVKPDQLPQLSGGDGIGDWIGIGSAFDSPTLGSLIEANYKNTIRAIIHNALPCAIDVAVIAHRQWQRGIGLTPPDQAAPLYLRNNVAQTIEQRADTKAEEKASAEANRAAARVGATIAQSMSVDAL